MAVSIIYGYSEVTEDFTNQRLTGANAACNTDLKGGFHDYNLTITESILITEL